MNTMMLMTSFTTLPVALLIAGVMMTLSAIITRVAPKATRLYWVFGSRRTKPQPQRWDVLAACLSLAVLLGTFSFATAGGLYDDIVEDIAFVRFVHAAPGQDSSEVRIMAVPFLSLEPQQVSPYQSLAPGSITIEIAGNSGELELNSGDFYTVVLQDEGLLILEDSALDDPTRTLLSLYNLSDIDALSLSSADGSAEVFREVARQSKASIAVNATDISLAVSGDGEVLEVLEDVRLERAEAYSIFALASDEGTVFLWVQADVVSE